MLNQNDSTPSITKKINVLVLASDKTGVGA
jgi:hypothetical protein